MSTEDDPTVGIGLHMIVALIIFILLLAVGFASYKYGYIQGVRSMQRSQPVNEVLPSTNHNDTSVEVPQRNQ